MHMYSQNGYGVHIHTYIHIHIYIYTHAYIYIYIYIHLVISENVNLKGTTLDNINLTDVRNSAELF